MGTSAYVALGLIVAVVVVVLLLRQRGVRQRGDIKLSALGAKAHIKTSIEPEMEGIRAGRDVKAFAGAGDPARMKEIDAGRDVVRDTRGDAPKT